MTDRDGWQQQPGGLWLKVSSYDRSNAELHDATINVMRSSIQTVAQTHGASFSEQGFRNNMQAVYRGDLEVDLYLAKWDVFERKPVCVGAAFGWETYGFKPDGQLARAFYTEDVCVLKSQLRPLIATKPMGASFPDESLAKCLERINLQQMAAEGIVYRYGEVDRDNTAMMRQLRDNEARMGTGLDSAVLEYKHLPNTLLDKLPMDVTVTPIRRNGIESKRHFLARYKEGPYDLRFIVTIGQATASGQRRADIRAWHNGNVPNPEVLDCVINSSLFAIKQKLEEPQLDIGARAPSPSIPIMGTRREQQGALFGACGTELGFNPADRANPLGQPMPDTHVFVQNDAPTLRGFQNHGAMQRLFGNKPMIPGVNVL